MIYNIVSMAFGKKGFGKKGFGKKGFGKMAFGKMGGHGEIRTGPLYYSIVGTVIIIKAVRSELGHYTIV